MINDLPKSLIEAAQEVLDKSDTHIDVDGELKHRYNSEGRLIHHTEDGIRNFHKWFGNSKVVDKHGRPQVVYHGTADDIKEFDLNHPNRKDSGWIGNGVYVGNKDMAGTYANIKHGKEWPNVMPLYVRAHNPYEASLDEKKKLSKMSRDQVKQVTDHLKSNGHDATVLRFNDEDYEMCVFDPKHVKSAIGNKHGTFDGNSTKLTESYNWAYGDNKKFAQNPNRQVDDSTVVWLNAKEVLPLVHPDFRVTPEDKTNHIGNRMSRAVEHLTSGKWMDPPDVHHDPYNPQYPVAIGNGRHRIAASLATGQEWFPANVSKEDIPHLEKHLTIGSERQHGYHCRQDSEFL